MSVRKIRQALKALIPPPVFPMVRSAHHFACGALYKLLPNDRLTPWQRFIRDGHDTLHGEGQGYSFDLSLDATKRPTLQHDLGYTDYSFGGYTSYYSRERMAVSASEHKSARVP